MSKPEFQKRTPHGIKPVQRTAPPLAKAGSRPAQRDRLSWHQFQADPARYQQMPFRACGRSGLKLPAISLGAWETFGGYVGPEQARACIFRAFNLGITYFDLANNYGTPPGRAEVIVGRTLREVPREEIIVATKAGFLMWPGPYGDGGSRKYLLTSIDQSLRRLGLDHVDIFYSHRPDPNTPLEETMRALQQILLQGKTLYVGLSNYPGPLVSEACRMARDLGFGPLLVNQVRYSMFNREIEHDVVPAAREHGLGIVAFSVLAQGLLSTKYLEKVPEGSRAARRWSPAQREEITPALREKIRRLNEIARARGQTLPQMAIAWTLRRPEVTSALIGASEVDQLEENVNALANLHFREEELQELDAILAA